VSQEPSLNDIIYYIRFSLFREHQSNVQLYNTITIIFLRFCKTQGHHQKLFPTPNVQCTFFRSSPKQPPNLPFNFWQSHRQIWIW